MRSPQMKGPVKMELCELEDDLGRAMLLAALALLNASEEEDLLLLLIDGSTHRKHMPVVIC
jgi:hypothetical protein